MENPLDLKDMAFDRFQIDPIKWMEDQIEESLMYDALTNNVLRLAQSKGYRNQSKDFYIMLAFYALLEKDRLLEQMLEKAQKLGPIL